VMSFCCELIMLSKGAFVDFYSIWHILNVAGRPGLQHCHCTIACIGIGLAPFILTPLYN
jgi:hypothetical protein